MDLQLYKAAQLGDSNVIRQYADSLDSQLTPNKNTVLHVLSQYCDSSFAVEQILGMKHSLLSKVNAKGETALHIATRNRHFGVVRALIDCAKESEKPEKCGFEVWRKTLRMINKNGDTSLHLAVRNNCYQIVESLVKEDDAFAHPLNKAGESPLYIAVERGYHDIVDLILRTCKSPSYEGPRGTTVLHCAAVRNSIECMKLILDKVPNLTKEVDMYGRSALHFAARFNHQEGVRLLLSADKSLAYIRSHKDDCCKTALHVAVIFGHLNLVVEILSHCPDCWEMVTSDSHNLLHLAVENEQKQVLDFILDNVWASELINEVDLDGNTPLHLYASSKQLDGCNLVNHTSADKSAFNAADFTPLDVIISTTEQTERLNAIKDELQRNGATQGFRFINTNLKGKHAQVLSKSNQCHQSAKDDTYLIIAALIVTVTFAAGFTVPGGYESNDGPNKGMAVLRHKTSFIVFIVTDLIALICAAAAVFIQFEFPSTSREDHGHWIFFCYSSTVLYIRVSMTAMVIAFVSGMYAVLSSPIIKAVLCFAAVNFFPVIFGFSVLYVFPSTSVSRRENEAWLQLLRKRFKVILLPAFGRLSVAVIGFRFLYQRPFNELNQRGCLI